MRLKMLIGACAVALAAVGCAQSDAGITTAVKNKLIADDLVKARQINVDTADKVVTLTGEHADRARVLLDRGGSAVKSGVVVLGSSGFAGRSPAKPLDPTQKAVGVALALGRGVVGQLGVTRNGHAESAENIEIGARIAAHVGQHANHEDGRLDAVLEQRPRDDEAVATVVTATAENGDAAIQLRLVRGFDGGDDLPAGVLHQDERRNADLVDGVAIGFSHLRGGQDSHG